MTDQAHIIYRGKSPAGFGLWRQSHPGKWLFSTPVRGAEWRATPPPNPDDPTSPGDLIRLVDLIEPSQTSVFVERMLTEARVERTREIIELVTNELRDSTLRPHGIAIIIDEQMAKRHPEEVAYAAEHPRPITLPHPGFSDEAWEHVPEKDREAFSAFLVEREMENRA